MIIRLNAQRLTHELRQLARVVPKADPTPLALCVLFRAEAKLSLHAVNPTLGFGMNIDCEATVEEPGEIAVPFEKLSALAEYFPDAMMHIDQPAKDKVRLMCDGFVTQLSLMDAKFFPTIPDVKGPSIIFPAGVLKRMIDHTRFAVPDQKFHHLVSGVLLESHDGQTAMIALDSKKLSISATTEVESLAVAVIVPSHLLDVLAGYAESVTYVAGLHHIFFSIDRRTLYSLPMAVKFPAYKRAIPKENLNTALIVTEHLLTIVRRVSALLTEKLPDVDLLLDADALRVTAVNGTVGDANDVIKVEYGGPAMTLRMAWKHLLDFLTSATEPRITLNVRDHNNPTLWTDGENHQVVIAVVRQSRS